MNNLNCFEIVLFNRNKNEMYFKQSDCITSNKHIDFSKCKDEIDDIFKIIDSEYNFSKENKYSFYIINNANKIKYSFKAETVKDVNGKVVKDENGKKIVKYIKGKMSLQGLKLESIGLAPSCTNATVYSNYKENKDNNKVYSNEKSLRFINYFGYYFGDSKKIEEFFNITKGNYYEVQNLIKNLLFDENDICNFIELIKKLKNYKIVKFTGNSKLFDLDSIITDKDKFTDNSKVRDLVKDILRKLKNMNLIADFNGFDTENLTIENAAKVIPTIEVRFIRFRLFKEVVKDLGNVVNINFEDPNDELRKKYISKTKAKVKVKSKVDDIKKEIIIENKEERKPIIMTAKKSKIKDRKFNEDILTVPEMMDMLAIGRNTAYKLLKNKEIEGFKLGNNYKVLRRSVMDYIYRQANL